MATVAEITAALTQLAADTQAEHDEVQAKLSALATQVSDLAAQLAACQASGVATQADLDGFMTSVTAISAGVKGISEA